MPNNLNLPKCRIIPKLEIKSDSLVKGINLEGLRVLGRPELFAEKYYKEGADEIIYQDVVASLYGKNTLTEIVNKTASNLFIPLTVGGGIRSLEDIKKLLNAGADKVSINSAAVKNPNFIKEAAETFGSSTISVSVETNKIDNEYLVFTENGRNLHNISVIHWIEQIQSLGAGEVILTSISKEGLGLGLDLELLNQVRNLVNIPLVINGGVGKIDDIKNLISNFKVSGVAVGSAFHYYYLNSFIKDKQISGNKDFTLGLVENTKYNCFSIKKLNQEIEKL